MIKRPLGRGLSALISTDQQLADRDEIREIEIDLIHPGQQQPRTFFDEAKLEELAQSIRTTGIIQPRMHANVHEFALLVLVFISVHSWFAF